jgi:hypothetical protein
MSFYFVCPGEASVTSTTVQCTQAITTVDASGNEPYFTYDQRQTIIDGTLTCLIAILVCWLCKKALDI